MKLLTLASLLVFTFLTHGQELLQHPNEFQNYEAETWRSIITESNNISTRDYFDVLFYELNVNIKIDRRYISGDVKCRFKSLNNNTSFVVFDLHNSLNVYKITGNVSSYEHTGDSIKIFLANELTYDEVSEIEIYYEGEPDLAGGYKGLVYETHGNNEPVIATLSTPFLAHYWWPCKDGPADKPDSVYINITIPDTTINGIPLIAVSNGKLENVVLQNGMKTFQWRERYPIVTYYVMAAISNYRTFEQIFETNSGKEFPIVYNVFDDHLEEAHIGVAQLPEAIALFSEYFGEYPFANEKYGMTQLGFYGAIENQTNTITNNMSLSWFSTSVHELAHMWFGDMITCKTWNHGWLNEGFATYSEALWAESVGGFDQYKAYVSSFEYFRGGTLYLQDDTDPFNIFISIIYNKGAYVLHMLRGILGDKIFFECLNTYATHPDFKYSHAETSDFKKVCEDLSGIDLDYFFDQWVYNEGYPEYNYGWRVTEENETFKTNILVEQTQTIGPVFKMPVEFVVEFIDGTKESVIVWDSTKSVIFELSFGKEPVDIQFDPDNWILKKVNQILYEPPLNRGILLVNGLPWNEEVYESYQNKAYWGEYDISFWDLNDVPSSGYPNVLPSPMVNGDLKVALVQNYSTLVWISGGNDASKFDKEFIKSYLNAGGNIVLLTSSARSFLDDSLKNYLGITWNSSPLSTIKDFKSVYHGLSNIDLSSNQVFINIFETEITSEYSSLLYQANEGFDVPKGVGVAAVPEGKGKFILITCKPYAFDYSDLSNNMEYIFGNLLNEPVTGLENDVEKIVDFRFIGIYPNPFNPEATIEFSLPVNERVSISVYNMLGQKVEDIVQSNFEKGIHSLKWNASGLSSGVYLIQIKAGQLNRFQKALLLK